MDNVVKALTAGLITMITFVFGGWDIALQSICVAIVLDYLTGVSRAYVTKELSSSIGFKGIVKKVSILALVAIATQVDNFAGDTGLIRNLVIYYLVANEGLSIVENLAAMDLWIPKVLKDRLKQIRGEDAKKKGKSTK